MLPRRGGGWGGGATSLWSLCWRCWWSTWCAYRREDRRGTGVHLSPALTSSFIWSVNSRWGEEGEREGKEERELVGVSGDEAGGLSKVL